MEKNKENASDTIKKDLWKKQYSLKIIAMVGCGVLVPAIILAVIFGFLMGSKEQQIKHDESSHLQDNSASKNEIWTCSMHPQIRQPKPGKCPLCGMALIPAATSTTDESAGRRELKLSAYARKLAEIQTAPVERKAIDAQVRMVGKVAYNETKIGYITSRIAGRIDDLKVDFTGIEVKRGDHMVYLYSPELMAAQEELIQAIKSVKALQGSELASVKRTSEQMVEAARSKLRLWGLGKKQIAAIEKRGTASDHMMIYSPMSGVVIHKNAIAGQYVETGTRIYTIADLSHLWVVLEAYESDLIWIRHWQDITFEVEAYPGETFLGKISFIDPVVNPKTRTVKVRIDVDNSDGRLKPDMFVRAVVNSSVAAAGKVMDPSLADKWICPMHPSVVRDKPGRCPICQMHLKHSSKLGYSKIPKQSAPLIIPASAALITGKRTVVYVEKEPGVYEGREIERGVRAGNYYIVKSGLFEGEMVVTNGNFKIDSALQLLAKPSMMDPEGAAVVTDHTRGKNAVLGPRGMPKAKIEAHDSPTEFKAQLDPLFDAYFEIHQALSTDNLNNTKSAATKMTDSLSKIKMNLLKGPAHTAWMKTLADIQKSLKIITQANDLLAARESFADLSGAVESTVLQFGTSHGRQINRFFCSMAFESQGSYWLQENTQVENPYYGADMYRCGDAKGVVKKANNGAHHHD